MYTYNANGEIEQLLTQHWNTTPGQWENETRILYNYSATGINPLGWTGPAPVVFPNPFEDQLTIDGGSPEKYAIQVFNAAGQLVSTFNSQESVTNLNLGNLQQGVYFMKIKSQKNEQTVKLLKAR